MTHRDLDNFAFSTFWYEIDLRKGRKGVACKVHDLKYLKVDTLSIKVVPDDLYYDYNNLAET